MEVDVVLWRKLRKFFQRVDGAGLGRAGHPDYGKNKDAVFAASLEFLAYSFDAYPMMLVYWHLEQATAANARTLAAFSNE